MLWPDWLWLLLSRWFSWSTLGAVFLGIILTLHHSTESDCLNFQVVSFFRHYSALFYLLGYFIRCYSPLRFSMSPSQSIKFQLLFLQARTRNIIQTISSKIIPWLMSKTIWCVFRVLIPCLLDIIPLDVILGWLLDIIL